MYYSEQNVSIFNLPHAYVLWYNLQAKESSNSSCNEMVSSLWLKGAVSAIAFLRAPASAAQISQVSLYALSECMLNAVTFLQI